MNALRRTFGLTGGIASGKSTVGGMFAEFGAKVIDADRLGHELIRSPLPTYHEIVHHFGFEILDAEGEIDRKCLGGIVFADPEKLRLLNSIVHPRVIERVGQLATAYHLQDPHAVVLVEAALHYEAGIADRFAKMLVAWCRPEQQLERLIATTGVSREEAERRIAAQMSAAEKRRRADYVIDCSGTLEETSTQAKGIYAELSRSIETR
jgi:dephospho-CoA kinase